jgi:hypothetical protein
MCCFFPVPLLAFLLAMPYNFSLSDFCKYVAIYVTPPDITPMLSKPANADIGGINCTMIPTFGCN